jgi:septal ring factor EnvC (AmiA/AmiB activator)
MMKRLRDEKGVLEKNIDSAQKECLALDEKIRKSTSDEENSSTSIDDAIQTPAPLYKQLI